jgi:hypothetical protein
VCATDVTKRAVVVVVLVLVVVQGNDLGYRVLTPKIGAHTTNTDAFCYIGRNQAIGDEKAGLMLDRALG